MFINFNTRSKTSIFTAYAIVSVVGFAGLWFGAKGSDSLTTTESFLAFYGFFCTTVLFYVLASQKASIEQALDMIHEESGDRSREIEAVYRNINENSADLRRQIGEIDTLVYEQIHRSSKQNCCNDKVAY